jgi:hypothetical protein
MAKEINKKHNSFWLLFFFVTQHSNIYNNKETNLITGVITINKKQPREELKEEGHVKGVIATGFKKFNLPASVSASLSMPRLGDCV